MFPQRYLPCPPSSLPPPLEVKKKAIKGSASDASLFSAPASKKTFYFFLFSCFLFATVLLASPQKLLSFKHCCETLQVCLVGCVALGCVWAVSS